jgi:hypothetical protein
VARWRDFQRERVAAVGGLTLLPRNVAAKEGAARGAGALARDARKLGGVLWQLVEIRNRPDEGCESGRRRCEPRRSGEVVLGDDLEGQRGELWKRGVRGFERGTKAAELTETCLLSRAGDILRFAVEEELVRAEGSGAGGGGVCAQVGLGEGYGEGGVCGEV